MNESEKFEILMQLQFVNGMIFSCEYMGLKDEHMLLYLRENICENVIEKLKNLFFPDFCEDKIS